MSRRAARVLVAAGACGVLLTGCSRARPDVIVGKVSPAPEAQSQPGPPEVEAPGLAPPGGLARATGTGPGAARPFRGAVDVPGDLLFFLVIGSDARPGQDMARTRADSIHLVAVDPVVRRGTILGLPRDSYVPVPGHGRQKINNALAFGGPQLLARTVRELTGLPVSYYALTAFEGLVNMVDELGGLDVHVDKRMNDSASGARFDPGWHHMDGRQVLAYARDRHSFSDGDFTRSANHGKVLLHALEKLRAETEDADQVARWVDVAFRHAGLDMSPSDALRLGIFARTLFPSALRNVVAPGRARKIDGQSVVELSDEAFALFKDIGADAQADGRTERALPSPSASATASPAPVTPSPSPKPTPTRSPTPSPSSPPRTPVRSTPTPSPTGLLG